MIISSLSPLSLSLCSSNKNLLRLAYSLGSFEPCLMITTQQHRSMKELWASGQSLKGLYSEKRVHNSIIIYPFSCRVVLLSFFLSHSVHAILSSLCDQLGVCVFVIAVSCFDSIITLSRLLAACENMKASDDPLSMFYWLIWAVRLLPQSFLIFIMLTSLTIVMWLLCESFLCDHSTSAKICSTSASGKRSREAVIKPPSDLFCIRPFTQCFNPFISLFSLSPGLVWGATTTTTKGLKVEL